MDKGVSVEHRGPVAVITLANPARRNALDPGLCAELARAVVGLPAAGARAAVLTGAGDRAFSAGFDLEALAAAPEAGEAAFDDLVAAMAASPVPIVAAVNGAALGGGCELAAACDLRVGHPGVTLALPPARLGLCYHPRALVRFAALCGESRARALFLAAQAVDGAEAHRWGLLDELCPAGEVLPRALGRAEAIAELAPLAVAGMRRCFELLLARRAAPASLAEAAEIAALRARARRSADLAEGLAAAAGKRKPVFHGR